MKEGWKYKPFGEVFPIKMGKTPPRGDKSCWDTKKESDNKWVSISDISQNEGKVIFDTKEYITDAAAEKIFRVKANSLLMSFKLTIGKMAFAGTDLYTNEAIIAIPENKEYNLKFLYFYLSSYNWSSLTDGNEKVKGKTLNKESIGRIKLPIISLPDQQRIVSYLDAEFAKIEALKANAEKQLQAAKDLFQAALKELLTPKEGWVEKKLGELCEKTKNIKWTENSETHQYIDLSSVSRDSLAITDSITINYKNAPSRAKQIIKTHDILFATTRPTLRRLCIVNNNYDNEICSTGFCVLRPNSTIFYGYLFFSLLTDDFYKYIEPLQTGANYPAVTDGIVKQYVLFIPPSLSEQQRIADRLDALSANVKALQTNYTETITLCNDLKQALLKKVFG